MSKQPRKRKPPRKSRKRPRYIVINGKRHLRSRFFREPRYYVVRHKVPFWSSERTHWRIAPGRFRWGLLWDRTAQRLHVYKRCVPDLSSIDTPVDLELAREFSWEEA